jgi:hypothetical protein
MKKNDYQKPTMQVVLLRQQYRILSSSGNQAGVNDYNIEEEETW